MASGFENEEKIKALPQEGVHCFAASSKQITTRRIVSVILTIVFIAAGVFFIMTDGLGLGIMALIAAVITALVFGQTFLIANYRVAVDYNMKEIVLRYRYSKVKIPFENLDSRDGEASKAEELLEGVGNKEKVFYLIFDDVYDEVCFQTSTNDLASREDFFKLKEEAFAIADAYGARNSEDAIKPLETKHIKKHDVTDEDIEDLIDSVDK